MDRFNKEGVRFKICPLFDAHCHLQDKRLVKKLPSIFEAWDFDSRNSTQQGYLACCGTNESDWEKVATMAQRHHVIIPNFGVHPWQVNTLSDTWEQTLEAYLYKIPSGIGEIGLDFTDPLSNRHLQEQVFIKQLDLANKLGLPVSIHIRRAWDIFIRILKRLGPLPHGGLIHSYSGSCDMIPVFEGYNLFISFSGSITNPGNKKVARALKRVSFDRVLIETDSPDIMPRLPVPCREKINTPNNLIIIAEAAAKILTMPTLELACQTFENATRLFAPITPMP